MACFERSDNKMWDSRASRNDFTCNTSAEEPRSPANARDAEEMLSQSETRQAPFQTHEQGGGMRAPHIDLSWFTTPRGLNGDEICILFVLLASDAPQPFVVDGPLLDRILATKLLTTRRKMARAGKSLADKGHVTITKDVMREARAFNTVSPKLRAKIFARDKLCQRCGAEGGLTIDHILARCLGGENVEENLQALCLTCNCSKATDERLEVARRASV